MPSIDPSPRSMLARHCQLRGMEEPVYETSYSEATKTHAAIVRINEKGRVVTASSAIGYYPTDLAAHSGAAQQLLEHITTPAERQWLKHKAAYRKTRNRSRAVKELALYCQQRGWAEPVYNCTTVGDLHACHLEVRKASTLPKHFRVKAPSQRASCSMAARAALTHFGQFTSKALRQRRTLK